ncbi:MAG TPA: S-adenosylmethionine decarboxylase [Patescibacteria group bacterium]
MQQKRYHIIIDLENISPQYLTNEKSLRDFLKKLPSVINMHVLKGPIIAKGIPENPGLSGLVIIDYSHISIHTFSKSREALVDIFSCKPYDVEKAKEAVLDYFHLGAHTQTVSWA